MKLVGVGDVLRVLAQGYFGSYTANFLIQPFLIFKSRTTLVPTKIGFEAKPILFNDLVQKFCSSGVSFMQPLSEGNTL